MSGRELVLFLQAIALLGSALTTVKLYRSGLYKRYRIFFCYFLFRIPNGIWSLLLPANSKFYFYFWEFTEPLFWIFQVLVVRELIGLILQRHKGLYTLGRWAMYVGIAVSVALSVLSLAIKFTAATPARNRGVAFIMGADRGVNFCLALFLVFMVLFISRYPVSLGRNIVLHTVLFTAFFLGNSLTDLFRSLFGIRLYTTIDSGLMALAAICTFGWFFFLTPKGEEVEMNLIPVSPEREEQMLSHLDSLNATLLNLGRHR
jgi:hypothetical protein